MEKKRGVFPGIDMDRINFKRGAIADSPSRETIERLYDYLTVRNQAYMIKVARIAELAK